MKRGVWIVLIILLAVIVIGFVLFSQDSFNVSGASCDIKEIRETPVSLELAKTVALDNVNKNNPPFDWVYVGGYLSQNSLGDSIYYVLIFRKIDFTELTTLDVLEQNAQKFSDSESDDKSQFNNIATVMTGSMKEDKLIQRHFRGLPEAIGKRLEIKQIVEENYPGETIGDLIMNSPSDAGYYEIVSKETSQSSGNLISVYDNSIVSVGELNNNLEMVEKRKRESYKEFSDSECELLMQSAEQGRLENIGQWNSFE